MTGETRGGPGGTDLDESEKHRLLTDGLRRALVDALIEAGPGARLSLAEAAAAVDADAVATELHHVHLPRFEAAGAVEYDPDRNRLRVTEGVLAFEGDR